MRMTRRFGRLAALLALALLCGCTPAPGAAQPAQTPQPEPPAGTPAVSEPAPTAAPAQGQTPAPDPAPGEADPVAALLQQMTLDENGGELLTIRPD